MWLAQSMKQAVPTADADQGISTIVGDQMGVVTRGEVRQLPIYGPGGYVWLPESGASVLVIKGGPGGEEQCVCGGKQAAVPKGMQPGEVYIYHGYRELDINSILDGAALDPYSGFPAYRSACCNVRRK